MLKEEKRRELDQLVGKQNADKLIQNMQAREKSAQRQGTAYKAVDGVSVDDVNDFVDAVNDSVKDSLKAKKRSATVFDEIDETDETEMKAPGDDDEMDEEEMDEEEMDEEFLLTDTEIQKIADAVAKRLSTDMKGMGMYGRKSKDDSDLVATLKGYTEQHEAFAAAMVDALEAVDTRLKELADVKSTFTPSTTHKNVVVDKDGNMAGLNEVEQAAYRMWFQNQ